MPSYRCIQCHSPFSASLSLSYLSFFHSISLLSFPSFFLVLHLSLFHSILPSSSFFLSIFLSSSPPLFRLLQPYFFYSISNSTTITSVLNPLHLSSLTSVYFLPFLPLHLSFPPSIFLPSMIHLS